MKSVIRDFGGFGICVDESLGSAVIVIVIVDEIV
jgi:hypothetical protein